MGVWVRSLRERAGGGRWVRRCRAGLRALSRLVAPRWVEPGGGGAGRELCARDQEDRRRLGGHLGGPGGRVGVVEGPGGGVAGGGFGPTGRDQHRGGEGDLGHLQAAALAAEAGRRVAQGEAVAAPSQRDSSAAAVNPAAESRPGGDGRRPRICAACVTSAARPGRRRIRTPRPPTGASTPAGTSGTATTPKGRSPGRSGSHPSSAPGSSRSSARSVTPPTTKPARKAAANPSKPSTPTR